MKGPADRSPTGVGADNVPNGDGSRAAAAEDPAGTSSLAWEKLISPASLEDLVKGGKLRLDRLVTTPAAFIGGGYVQARKEFSLQALLFAIVESYPQRVRWKNSAAVARERFARVAANTLAGSADAYQEARNRLLDLNDLLSGAALESATAPPPIKWSQLIDRVPMMQLLEWAHEEQLAKMVANENQFAENADRLQRYAELIAVLGKVALDEDMPDAADDDYAALAKEMIAHAQDIVRAVQTNNPQLARAASGQLGQCCTRCHDSFR
ncbi:MAG: cytochrome c [Planctomycetales bacterium]|nr:cytochrome c [Planctomycetales bacterium]